MIKGAEIILRNKIHFLANRGIAYGNGIFRNQTSNGCYNVSATIVTMFERQVFIAMPVTFIFMIIGNIMFPQKSTKTQIGMFLFFVFKIMLYQKWQLHYFHSKGVPRKDLKTKEYGYGFFQCVKDRNFNGWIEFQVLYKKR